MVKKLLERGIEVARPGKVDHSVKIKIASEGKMVETPGFHTLSPRDLIFFYHDTVYFAPPLFLSSQSDIAAYKWLAQDLRKLGSKWMKSWKGAYDENTPYWEAANLLRVGLDIVFLISVSGNELGYQNFRQLLDERYNGRVRIHPLRNSYSGIHIDTTLTLIGWNEKLGKYLVFADQSVTDPTTIPPIFRGKNWVVLEITKEHIIDFGTINGYEITSPKLAENFFMINSKLAVVDEKQTKIVKLLQFYGIECLESSNPYGREVGGGFHCMTNDWNRQEEKDFNKVLDDPLNTNISNEDLNGLFDGELLEILQRKGDVDQWNDICNREKIFPTYATQHLKEEKVKEMLERHQKVKELQIK